MGSHRSNPDSKHAQPAWVVYCRRWQRLRELVLGVWLGVFPLSSASARDPAPRPVSHAPAALEPRDSLLAIAARRNLQEDEVLAHLNLGVSVRRGVATVWGPVPTAEAAVRALNLVRQVPGLDDVRGELYLSSTGEPPKTPMPKPDTSTFDESLRQPVVSTGPTPNSKTTTTTVHANGGMAVLKKPIPISAPASPITPSPAELTSSPKIEVSRPADPAPAVERLRRGDVRFGRLQVVFRDGVVSIGGSVTRGEDTYAFARAVAEIPGVIRVIVEHVQIDKNK